MSPYRYILIFPIIIATIVYSCKNHSDIFVGKWVNCNQPEQSFTISKDGDSYNIQQTGSKLKMPLMKMANEVLFLDGKEEIGLELTIRYDNLSKHLFTASGEATPNEFCKSE